MKIEILGPGCIRCNTLEENAMAAVEQLAIDAEVIKVKDIKEISSRGVLMTPALCINGRVVSTGRVLKIPEITKYIIAANEETD